MQKVAGAGLLACADSQTIILGSPCQAQSKADGAASPAQVQHSRFLCHEMSRHQYMAKAHCDRVPTGDIFCTQLFAVTLSVTSKDKAIQQKAVRWSIPVKRQAKQSAAPSPASLCSLQPAIYSGGSSAIRKAFAWPLKAVAERSNRRFRIVSGTSTLQSCLPAVAIAVDDQEEL